jgi:hypothetical protein
MTLDYSVHDCSSKTFSPFVLRQWWNNAAHDVPTVGLPTLVCCCNCAVVHYHIHSWSSVIKVLHKDGVGCCTLQIVVTNLWLAHSNTLQEALAVAHYKLLGPIFDWHIVIHCKMHCKIHCKIACHEQQSVCTTRYKVRFLVLMTWNRLLVEAMNIILSASYIIMSPSTSATMSYCLEYKGC